MQKEQIIQKLKEKGCRITKQRLIILDVILKGDCESCKEIYYKASSIDPKIGTATVYRMVNTLEEIGSISRRNMYKLDEDIQEKKNEGYEVALDDNTVQYFSNTKWNEVILAGMKACGYVDKQHIKSIHSKKMSLLNVK